MSASLSRVVYYTPDYATGTRLPVAVVVRRGGTVEVVAVPNLPGPDEMGERGEAAHAHIKALAPHFDRIDSLDNLPAFLGPHFSYGETRTMEADTAITNGYLGLPGPIPGWAKADVHQAVCKAITGEAQDGTLRFDSRGVDRVFRAIEGAVREPLALAMARHTPWTQERCREIVDAWIESGPRAECRVEGRECIVTIHHVSLADFMDSAAGRGLGE